MAEKTVTVKGVVGCAGLWGALNPDEVRTLDASIAESLVRAGHAIRVDADGNPLAEKKAKGARKPSETAGAS